MINLTFAIAPDTQQNIFYTVAFILLHNWQAILYLAGIIVFTIWSFVKPTRIKLLIMWGLIILLFAFEFEKHIAMPLRDQARQSLITERQSYRIGYIVDFVILRAMPNLLPILGWMMVIGGGIMGLQKRKKKDTL